MFINKWKCRGFELFSSSETNQETATTTTRRKRWRNPSTSWQKRKDNSAMNLVCFSFRKCWFFWKFWKIETFSKKRFWLWLGTISDFFDCDGTNVRSMRYDSRRVVAICQYNENPFEVPFVLDSRGYLPELNSICLDFPVRDRPFIT